MSKIVYKTHAGVELDANRIERVINYAERTKPGKVIKRYTKVREVIVQDQYYVDRSEDWAFMKTYTLEEVVQYLKGKRMIIILQETDNMVRWIDYTAYKTYEAFEKEEEEYSDGLVYIEFKPETIQKLKDIVEMVKQTEKYLDAVNGFIMGSKSEEEFMKMVE